MTLDDLKAQFPVGCNVQLTAQARAQGYAKIFRGETGVVEHHWQRCDMAGNPFFTLQIWIIGRNRREDCQPSLWERVEEDPHA